MWGRKRGKQQESQTRACFGICIVHLAIFSFFPCSQAISQNNYPPAHVQKGMLTISTKQIHFFSAATTMDVLNLNQECDCTVLTSTEKFLSKYRIINLIISHASCLRYVQGQQCPSVHPLGPVWNKYYMDCHENLYRHSLVPKTCNSATNI